MTTEAETSSATNSNELTELEKNLELKISKLIEKLKFYLEETDTLIQENELSELQIAAKRTDEIRDELNVLISRMQEVKLDLGITTQRAIRQWKKDVKASYAPLLEIKENISRTLDEEERKRSLEAETIKLKLKFEEEEKFRLQLQAKEKALWEERLEAEIKLTEKKLELENAAKTSRAKLPKLKITAFKGTPEDWIRFENIQCL